MKDITFRAFGSLFINLTIALDWRVKNVLSSNSIIEQIFFSLFHIFIEIIYISGEFQGRNFLMTITYFPCHFFPRDFLEIISNLLINGEFFQNKITINS